MQYIKINTDFIKLQLANVVGSGSDAKFLILDGLVMVNDVVVLQRGKKVKHNDIIKINLDNIISFKIINNG